MKRFAALLLALILMHSACLAGDGLIACNDALADKSITGRVEISNLMPGFTVYNQGDLNYSNVKIIIMERVAPGKEFTELDSGYPDNYVEGFPSDFAGIDDGEYHMYLRKDLMSKLNKNFRASSYKECTWLVILENFYEQSSTLINTEYKYIDNSVMPDFETVEEMTEWLNDREVEIDSITYYPAFGCYSMVNIYDKNNRGCTYYDLMYTNHSVKSKNSEAFAVWNNIGTLVSLYLGITADKMDKNSVYALLSECTDFIADSKVSGWETLISSGNLSFAAESVYDSIWTTAKELMTLDPDSAETYSLIIDAQDYSALSAYVNYCNYNGLEKSMAQIGESGDYMGTYDSAWMEQAALKLIAELNALL